VAREQQNHRQTDNDTLPAHSCFAGV